MSRSLDPVTRPLAYRCRREAARRMLTPATCTAEGRLARRLALANLAEYLGDPYCADLDRCDGCEGPLPIEPVVKSNSLSLLPNPAPGPRPDCTPPAVRPAVREPFKELPC